jgi:hypothetical protein
VDGAARGGARKGCIVATENHPVRKHSAKARWVGVLAVGASVVLGAGVARADERAGARTGGERELSGTVIKSEVNTLYIEHMGAVVPFTIGRDTRFSGVQSPGELAKGQQVRASFTLNGDTQNVAEQISLGAPRAREIIAPVFTGQVGGGPGL